MAGAALTAEQHRTRASEHAKVGTVLCETDNEWGAVMLFYAAYHEVKAALLDDPIFDDLDACQALKCGLLPDDRYTSRHQGRKGAHKEWGLNELTLVLYRPVAGVYQRLHQMSISVRYDRGLLPEPSVALAAWEQFAALRDSGELRSAYARAL